MKLLNDLRCAVNRNLARHERQQGQTVLAARPQFLIIDPTSRCNARCVMCPQSFRAPGQRGVDLPRTIFDKVSPVIAGAAHINLFSTGEPTLAHDLVFLMREALRRSNRRAPIWISTNGKHLLAPALLDVLRLPQMGLQFSVDAGSKELFETIRRGIGFNQLCASLDQARRLKQAHGHPALSFSCTISKRNLHDLHRIFALAKQHDVDQVIFYEEDPEVPEEQPFVLDQSDRPVFEAQLPFIESTAICYSNGLHFGEATLPPTDCLAPWRVFHLRADGTVRPCCTMRESLGDLSRASLDQVWNGPGFVGLRRAFLSQTRIPQVCRACTDPLRTWNP